MDYEERASRFRLARQELNKNGPETLMQVVEATGVALSTIHAFENPKSSRMPNGKTAATLAEHYGVNVAWLSGQSDNPLINEDMEAAMKQTGLSFLAVRGIRELTKDPQWQKLLNDAFESGTIRSLLLMLDNDSYSSLPGFGSAAGEGLMMRESSAVSWDDVSDEDIRNARIWKIASMIETAIK